MTTEVHLLKCLSYFSETVDMLNTTSSNSPMLRIIRAVLELISLEMPPTPSRDRWMAKRTYSSSTTQRPPTTCTREFQNLSPWWTLLACLRPLRPSKRVVDQNSKIHNESSIIMFGGRPWLLMACTSGPFLWARRAFKFSARASEHMYFFALDEIPV